MQELLKTVFLKLSVTADSSDWVSMGLENKSITALTVQHWGVGPVDGLTLFAAVIPEENDSTLLLDQRFTYQRIVIGSYPIADLIKVPVDYMLLTVIIFQGTNHLSQFWQGATMVCFRQAE